MNTLHQSEKDIIDFYQWLMLNKELGDESYLDFYFLIKVARDIMHKAGINEKDLANKTNKKNIVSRFFEIDKDLDFDAFRNSIFAQDDIIVKNKKWSLPFELT